MENVDRMADAIERSLGWVPSWAISLALLALAIITARWLHGMAFAVVTRIVGGMDLFWRSRVSRTKAQTRLATIIMALGAAASVAPLTVREASVVQQLRLVCSLPCLAGWPIRRCISG